MNLFALNLTDISRKKRNSGKSLLFSSRRYNLLYFTNSDETDYGDGSDLTLMRESYRFINIGSISRRDVDILKYKNRFKYAGNNYNRYKRNRSLLNNSISIYNYYHPHNWINNS